MQRLDLRVFPEAQIAAVYVLYALFGTQPSKPVSQIYISPSHRAGLFEALQVYHLPTPRALCPHPARCSHLPASAPNQTA